MTKNIFAAFGGQPIYLDKHFQGPASLADLAAGEVATAERAKIPATIRAVAVKLARSRDDNETLSLAMQIGELVAALDENESAEPIAASFSAPENSFRDFCRAEAAKSRR